MRIDRMSLLPAFAMVLFLIAPVRASNEARHWAYRPLRQPAIPEVKSTNWARTPIDHFILQKLESHQLKPSPDADSRTLIRRLHLDLIGLPPAPEEIQAFLDDRAGDAFERVVDELLASSRYGERWARHWIDTVHFAETHGHDQDRIRTNAWPYRDYVVASFNADKPYARFVKEQLAGDALFPADPQATVALGFLASGPWDESSLRDIREDTLDRQIGRYLDRDDMLTTVIQTFTSTTAQCARCHDHKFDPIPQRDYYALQAVFAGVDRANRVYDEDPSLHRRRQTLLDLKRRTKSSDAPLDFELANLPIPSLVYAAAADFEPDGGLKPAGGPRPVHVLHRGEITQPLEPAAPGSLSCISELPSRFTLNPSDDESARRAALAEWIAHRNNPLTWRSIVNRVWHYHFGRGLVDTPNDFGKLGSAPSHPELLDWLSVWFRDEAQGSLKRLHRLILSSSVYRQTSAIVHSSPQYNRDSDNRLLWRMNRTRLDAEQVRDAILSISGRLDLRMGGPSDMHFDLKPGIHVTPRVDYSKFNLDSPPGRRRSIYRFLFRTLPDPFMDALDCPAGDQLTPVRNASVTVQQALALWNNEFVLLHAGHLAARLERESSDIKSQIQRAFELALGRPPTRDETDEFAEYIHKHGLANFCRVLLNSNEFIFVN